MYEHYLVTGDINQISDTDATKLMKEISNQWEHQQTKLGVLSVGVYDWAFTNTGNSVIVHIPKLRTGGEIPLNILVTEKFKKELNGDLVYGDCFLKI